MDESIKLRKIKLDDHRNSPSGSSTPIFGWSPLPQRKHLRFTQKKKNEKEDPKEQKPDTKYYPNCDVNVWLRSCEKEIIDPINGRENGKFPEWINGCLIRNGPGSIKVGKDEFQHLFDSSALLHRFHVKNGKVTYQCRFLQSETYKRNWTANRLVLTEFGTKAVPDPCQTIFQRIAAIFTKNEQSDNSMISVYPFGDELYAFNEIPVIHKINIESLATEKRVNLSNNINIVSHSSHPHVMNDGSVYNLGLSMYTSGPYNTIVHFQRDENGLETDMFEKAQIVASVPSRWTLHPSYMHTFGITGKYFILVEQPLTISLPSILSSKIKNEPLAGCFRWYHEEYTQISVISRETGTLTFKFYADALFFLHIINQYEVNDHLVIDICAYRDPSMLDCMYIETMRNMQKNPDYAKMFRGRPVRFVLPLKPDEMELDINKNLITLSNTNAKAYYLPDGEILVKPEKLCDLGCETPRINYEKYLGRSYKYFYAISSDVDAKNPGTIIKVDVATKTCKTWCEENCYPSEPVFVPKPNSKFEDDGVILSALVWGKEDTNRVGLLILDATNLTELGRSEFQTPSSVPKCLHGWFIPNKNR